MSNRRNEDMDKEKSRFQTTRKWLIFWCLFIGIGAVAGSIGMLVAPDGSALGMDAMLPYFQVLPFADVLFQNFIFAGISLLIVNGLTNITAAVLMLLHKKIGVILGGIFGITLMLWICIQFYIFPMNFMSTIYFVFGLIQALTGLAALIFLRQETFARHEKSAIEQETFSRYKMDATESVNEENRSDKKNHILVVYFSRMGYTRHYAYELMKQYHADIYEVKATELTEGTKGFWWCGRFGMHRWDMPIEAIRVPLEDYDKIIICSPIWVFNLCAPMRSFCRQAAGRVKNADYVLVHFQKARYQNACREMNELLGITGHHTVSICVRQGREKRRYEF